MSGENGGLLAFIEFEVLLGLFLKGLKGVLDIVSKLKYDLIDVLSVSCYRLLEHLLRPTQHIQCLLVNIVIHLLRHQVLILLGLHLESLQQIGETINS